MNFLKKGTSYAFDYAAQNGHDSTLVLLKKEFPEIKCTSNAVNLAF